MSSTVPTDLPTSFVDLGVPASMASGLAARGIDAPFPIQASTIPEALAGRDLCGRAPTGSGKTIAFGIPLVLGVGKARPRKPRGLVLVPTRELAAQVCQELQLLARPKGPSIEAFYGGVGFERQIRALQRGLDIVVACPGRLADLINQRHVQLDEVEFVVLDEADRMADMGFLHEVRRLLDQCPTDRQTLLFSATLDGDVDVLITKYQRNPARHEFIADDEGGVQAEHHFWHVERLDRLKTAAQVVKQLGPTVVFCRTKRGADRIARQLDDAGVRAAAIHGDRSQAQRERALLSFHQGRVTALVATDVAARGIHVDGVEGVIHYDPPADHKDYVHRSGRTARAGNRGVVVTLVPSELRKDVAQLQKQLGYKVGLDPINFGALAGSPTDAVGDRASARSTSSEIRTAAPAQRSPQPRSERSERSERADRPERRQPTDRPARAERPERADRPERIERVADVVGPDGQRRPSGASRRKAKRLAATEAARFGSPGPADSEGWTDRDLRDGRSTRPAVPASRRPGAPGSRSAGSQPGAAKTGSRFGAKPGTGRANGSSTRGPSGSGSGSRGTAGSSTRGSAGGAAPAGAKRRPPAAPRRGR